MNSYRLEIPEVILFEPKIFEDHRGTFFESFNVSDFASAIDEGTFHSSCTFVQDNHSTSYKNVLRGLHYQINPHAQGKLVRAVVGMIFDVAVDIRPKSPTLGKHVCAILSAENRRQLWIPPGFAHGFMVMSNVAEVLYKATEFYCQGSERSIRWDDPDLNIKWPSDYPVLSEKDQHGLTCLSWKQYLNCIGDTNGD